MNKKFYLILTFFLFVPILLFPKGSNPKLFINYNFGITFVGKTGNNSEYQSSVNPFPLTPSHKVLSVGGSVNIKLYKKIFLGLNIQYFMNKKLTLTDPSDNDELIVDSLDFYNFFIDLNYRFTLFKLNSYASAGIGENLTKSAEEEWTNTKSGYKVFLPAVNSKISFIFTMKIGFVFPVSDSFDFFSESSFFYLTNEKTSLYRVSVGLSFIILNDFGR